MTILTATIAIEKDKSQDLGCSLSLSTYESESERKSVGFCIVFRTSGLLLWLMRAQHVHYESKSERISGGSYLLLPLGDRKREINVIVSAWRVFRQYEIYSPP